MKNILSLSIFALFITASGLSYSTDKSLVEQVRKIISKPDRMSNGLSGNFSFPMDVYDDKYLISVEFDTPEYVSHNTSSLRDGEYAFKDTSSLFPSYKKNIKAKYGYWSKREKGFKNINQINNLLINKIKSKKNYTLLGEEFSSSNKIKTYRSFHRYAEDKKTIFIVQFNFEGPLASASYQIEFTADTKIAEYCMPSIKSMLSKDFKYSIELRKKMVL